VIKGLAVVQRPSVINLHVAHVVKVEVVELRAVLAEADSSLFTKTHKLGISWFLNCLDDSIVSIISVAGEVNTRHGCPPDHWSLFRSRALRGDTFGLDLERVLVDIDNQSKDSIFPQLDIVVLPSFLIEQDFVLDDSCGFTDGSLLAVLVVSVPGISQELG